MSFASIGALSGVCERVFLHLFSRFWIGQRHGSGTSARLVPPPGARAGAGANGRRWRWYVLAAGANAVFVETIAQMRVSLAMQTGTDSQRCAYTNSKILLSQGL